MPTIVTSTTATADAAIQAAPGFYYGIRVTGDGTNAGQVVVYDNASAASGTVIDDVRCTSTSSSGEQMPGAIRVKNGIYVDVTTVGRVTVWHQDES